MKVGGQILWNVTAVFETSQIYFLMERGPMTPYNCDRSVPNPSIWNASLTWSVPRIRSVRGGNLEGWRTDCRPWGVGDGGRIGHLLEKTQCERGDISQRRRIYFSNRRWTNQNTRRRSGTENIHLDTASTNSRRQYYFLSCWIRRISSRTSRLTSGCRWSDERLLVHVGKLHIPPSRWTQSQTLLAERGIIPYSTEIHWCFQNNSYEFWCQERETHRWLLEYRWVSRLVDLWTGFTQFTLLDEKAPVHARSSNARALEVNGQARQAEGKAAVV